MSDYRMSAIGSCPRALSAMQLKCEPMPESNWVKLAAREGERHEEWIVEDLTLEGWTITDRHKEVKLVLPAMTITGHIDGIAEKNNGRFLLEIKTMSRFRFAAFGADGIGLQSPRFKGYAHQIAAYRECVDLPLMYVVKNRDTGQRIDLFGVEAPVPFSEVYDMMLAVEVAVRKGQLCDIRTSDDDDCKWCRFRYLCITEKAFDESMQGAVSPVDLRVAADTCLKALELEAQADELRKQCDPVLLKAVRGRDGTLTVGALSVSYVPESKSTTYPATALRKIVPADMLAKCAKETTRKEYIKCQDSRK